MVGLIPKPNKDATLIKNLRPIAVLPVIYKWYSRCFGFTVQRRDAKSIGVSDSTHSRTASRGSTIHDTSIGGEEQRVEKRHLALHIGH